MENSEHTERTVTNSIEQQTAKLPSDTYLIGAGIAIAMSLTLKMMGKKPEALFVGQWVAPILILGVYNKLVKQLGSD